MYVTQEAVSGDISYIRNENPCSIPCVRTVARLQGFSSRVLFKSSLQEFSSRVLFKSSSFLNSFSQDTKD